jgi:hypothetical protein
VLDPWYLTGVVEGLGRFSCGRSGRSTTVIFEVRMGAADASLAAAIQQALGGRIYRLRGGATTCVRVTRARELERVVEHLERYPLRGTKARRFAIWADLVRLKRATFRRPADEELARLVAGLADCEQ